MEIRIKEVLHQHGMTIAELSRRMGTNAGILVSGKYKPTVAKLEEIASLIGVPVWELLVDGGETPDTSGKENQNIQSCPHCGNLLNAKLSIDVIKKQ